MARVWHGSTTWKAHSLAEPRPGLCVTDTPERAQLYADAQASGIVDTEPRYVPGSAVCELETARAITWHRRPETHHTLDKAEATIDDWIVVSLTAYVSRYDLEHGVARYEGRYRSIAEVLRETYGDKLIIIVAG